MEIAIDIARAAASREYRLPAGVTAGSHLYHRRITLRRDLLVVETAQTKTPAGAPFSKGMAGSYSAPNCIFPKTVCY